MKYYVAFFIAIVLIPLGIAHASVRISEIAWMGTTESQFGEWFELYNNGTDAVNLSGWKLYEEGGAQLVFTFSKSIPGGGYLVVERTTGSSPDPLPGIDDESGPFGGSGFSNTGENLVLKDSSGISIESLNYSSGWLAGSAETKQTMQWDGSQWITATATPKAGIPGGGGGGGEVPPVPQASGATAWSAPRITPHIELFIPKTIYTTISSEYSAKTFLEYEEAYSGVFLWNMGDGTIYKATSPSPVVHTYLYEGTYTISFAYYKTPYDKKPFLVKSEDHLVSLPKITLRTIPEKGFEFTNIDTVPIDLSGWFIVLPTSTIELPPLTIIAPKKTVLMPFTSFAVSSVTSAILQTPDRVQIGVTPPYRTTISQQKNTSTGIDRINQPSDTAALEQQASSVEALPKQEQVSVKQNHTKTVVFSVVLFIVLALFFLIEKFREEE